MSRAGIGAMLWRELDDESLHLSVRKQTLNKYVKEQRLPDAETCL